MKKIQIILAAAVAVVAVSCAMENFGDGWYSYNGREAMADALYGEEVEDPSGNNFDEIKENDFIKAAEEPTSTFSIDADGAAYAYMRRCIKSGRLPEANSVRIEEYLNYFTFDYADPTGEETVAINAEIGDCPWNAEHKLLRLGLKGKSLADNDIPDANYIFLVDVSGSMFGTDRLDLLKSGLCNMVDYMKPTDRVAIITYAGSVQKVLESTLAKDAAVIKNAIKKLDASGSTAGGAAMKMAYDEAVEHYMPGGNNRIIMCTDGDFNVGVSNTDALVEMVESYLDKGIYLSIMGFGTGNYQDSRMESLSNHGNGTYTYVDSEEEMMKVFVNERSHFYSVANDTKCQITFDPQFVDSYRLIGYENRVMNNEDFEDDKKDAGEIGAGQTITALYEIIPADGYAPEAAAARFDVRYKLALGGESRPLSLNVVAQSEGNTPSANFSFAAGIAAYGLTLRSSQYKGQASFSMAYDLVNSARVRDPFGYRARFAELIKHASELQ